MVAVDFKHAAGRVSYHVGMTGDGKVIRKTKTYGNIAENVDSEDLYNALEAIAGLSAYTLIEVEKIETSTISE